MPRFKKVSFAILLGIVLIGCGANPNPVINKQTQSLQILQRLNEFQDVVVDSYASGSITPQHALLYSKFVVSATNTVKTLPDGWQATLKTGWSQLLTVVPLANMEPKIAITAKLIDALINAL